MKIIKNKILPFGKFTAINLFGIIFTKNKRLSAQTIRHETIHSYQMREFLFLFFYLWYIVEYIIRLIQYRDFMKAYYNISFEREAYRNDEKPEYLKTRKLFSSLYYLKL